MLAFPEMTGIVTGRLTNQGFTAVPYRVLARWIEHPLSTTIRPRDRAYVAPERDHLRYQRACSNPASAAVRLVPRISDKYPPSCTNTVGRPTVSYTHLR